MIPIEIRNGLPFLVMEVTYRDRTIILRDVLLDTGSHSTLLATDSVAGIGLYPERNDVVREIFGIGGSETVVEKRVGRIALAGAVVEEFPVELGAMDYGLTLDAIIGLDLLIAFKAIFDFEHLQLRIGQE